MLKGELEVHKKLSKITHGSGKIKSTFHVCMLFIVELEAMKTENN